MKINKLLISLLIIMTTSAQAHESTCDICEYQSYFDQTNFYAKFLSGVNFLQNTTTDGNVSSFQPGYLISGSIGYSWHYGLSLEAEYAFRRNEIRKINFILEGSSTNGHFQTSSYMVNLLWNLPLCAIWNIQPFVGVGVGTDFQQMHSSNSRIIFNQKWDRFAWQLMAGIAYPIFCNTRVTLEYKFHQGGRYFYYNSLGIGLIYKFD